MTKIYVNGFPVKPEDFVKIQSDPALILVTLAPFKFQTYRRAELDNHPNLVNHLQDTGILPKPDPVVEIRDVAARFEVGIADAGSTKSGGEE